MRLQSFLMAIDVQGAAEPANAHAVMLADRSARVVKEVQLACPICDVALLDTALEPLVVFMIPIDGMNGYREALKLSFKARQGWREESKVTDLNNRIGPHDLARRRRVGIQEIEPRVRVADDEETHQVTMGFGRGLGNSKKSTASPRHEQ